MSGPSVQLSFTLRTSPNVKTVHLLGSWDGYKSQLPLSATKDGKLGSWKGTFRFQGSHSLQLGSRYWYYYIVDGYHVSHDPAQDYTTEKTTGRKLNILDVPSGKSGSTSTSTSTSTKAPASYRKSHHDVPQGRSLSPGKIHHPRPSKPYASRGIREADYTRSPVDADDDLADRFANTRLSERRSYVPSPESSISSSSGGSTFSSARSGGSSPHSRSSVSSVCSCERFGITKSGQRVRLDCGGSRCGYSSGSASECSESSDEDDYEEEYSKSRSYGSRRNGTYVSAGRH